MQKDFLNFPYVLFMFNIITILFLTQAEIFKKKEKQNCAFIITNMICVEKKKLFKINLNRLPEFSLPYLSLLDISLLEEGRVGQV